MMKLMLAGIPGVSIYWGDVVIHGADVFGEREGIGMSLGMWMLAHQPFSCGFSDGQIASASII